MSCVKGKKRSMNTSTVATETCLNSLGVSWDIGSIEYEKLKKDLEASRIEIRNNLEKIFILLKSIKYDNKKKFTHVQRVELFKCYTNVPADYAEECYSGFKAMYSNIFAPKLIKKLFPNPEIRSLFL